MTRNIACALAVGANAAAVAAAVVIATGQTFADDITIAIAPNRGQIPIIWAAAPAARSGGAQCANRRLAGSPAW